MPGPGSYGPAGKWIHDRAHRIMEESTAPMSKSQAYAIATQQAHKVGKSPKDFRTPQGVHEARIKYNEPKAAYQKTAHLAAGLPYGKKDKLETTKTASIDTYFGDPLLKQAALESFLEELEAIEKEAGLGLKGLALAGMLAAGGMGVAKGAPKFLSSAAAASKPAIVQTLKASKNVAGGLGSQFRGAEMRGVMP